MFDLYVFTFHDDGRLYRSLSLLSPQEVHTHGLLPEAVLGEISALLPSMTPDDFEPNEPFMALLHEVVQNHAPALPELQAEAKAVGTGFVPLVDGRTTEVTVEDILGQFEVVRGEIVPTRYKPNPTYRLLTDNGPLQLPAPLEEAVLAAVRGKVRSEK
jgi:hypothetical protein